MKRDPDKVYAEIDDRIREDARKAGDFARVHAFARSAADVPDDQDARLVVLPAEHVYTKDGTSPAEVAAKTLLESRGNSPRLFRNSLVFLAADKARMQDLDEAVRRYLAWKSIVDEADLLDLGKNQRGQAETQLKGAASMVLARIPETYQWMLVPIQPNPQESVTFQATRLAGSDALAVRASKLRSEELLVTSLGPTILKKHLDDVPLWPEGRVSVRQLIDYFATYIYLPRLAGPDVLLGAIRGGLALLTWTSESFAFADSFDEEIARTLKRYEEAVRGADCPPASRRSAIGDSADGKRAGVTAVSSPPRQPRPPVPSGRGPIGSYSDRELQLMVNWVKSGGLLTDDQIVREVAEALGFERIGNRIDEAIRRAISRRTY